MNVNEDRIAEYLDSIARAEADALRAQLAAVVGVGADELELQIDDEIIVIRRPTDTELDATGGSHDR